MIKSWALFLATLVAAILLAVLALTPPTAIGPDAPPDQFSSSRAMNDVRIIAAEPHPTGTPENEIVRAYLKDRLKELGLDVEEHQSIMRGDALRRLDKWSGRDRTEQAIFNITGVLPGEDRSKPALLLMAHHDTVWDSPGASDDTMGVAVILEVLRAIQHDPDLKRDIVVLFTDAEELGLMGAKHFFEHNPLKDKIGAIINLEARGAGGISNLFQLNAGNKEAARLYGAAVRAPAASSLSAFVYSILPNDSDLSPALEADYIAYNIAITGKAGMYHSPLITPDELEETSLQHMGAQTLDLTRALISAEALPERSKDTVFFDAFGLFLISYAPFWGWVFLTVGTLGYAASVWGNFNQREVLSGASRMITFLLLGGGLLFGLNLLSGHGHTTEVLTRSISYYDRLAAIPKLEWLALFACLSVLILLFGRGDGNASRCFGIVTPIIILGFIGQAVAPTATYFISVPVFLAGLGMLALSRIPGTARLLLFMTPAVFVSGYLFALEHQLLVGVGPDMLSIAIVPAAIAMLFLFPIFPGLAPKPQRYLSLLFLVAAIGVALWIRLDPVAASAATY